MDWRERAIDVAITFIFSGVLLRLFQPAVFDYVCYAISRRKAKVKEQIEAMFAVEIARRDAAIEMVHTHKDILEFIVTSIKKTNEEMPQMTQVLNRVADSVDSLNTTCEKLNENQAATQVALGILEERTRMWERLHAMDLERLSDAGGRQKRIGDHLMQPNDGA